MKKILIAAVLFAFLPISALMAETTSTTGITAPADGSVVGNGFPVEDLDGI